MRLNRRFAAPAAPAAPAALPRPAVLRAPALLAVALLTVAVVALAVAALLAVPEPAGALSPPPSRDPLNSTVRLARLHYGGGGDWYANPTSLPNLARELRDRLQMEVEAEEGRVEPLDDELFDYPFVHMTGHGNVRFTSDEAERLRWYLVHGGFLFADDNYGMDDSFRRAIRQVFPEAELVTLPFDHELYHSVYDFPDGLPKIHEHHGGPPQGLALFHEGRMVMFYSYNTDIGDGLEDEDVHGDSPLVREQAMRMAINVVAYATSH